MNGDPRSILLAPVVSEKSYGLIAERGKYTFKVHPKAHKTQIRQAVEQVFGVTVTGRQRQQGAGQAQAPWHDRGHPRRLEEGRRHGGRGPDHRSIRTR